MDQRRTEEQQTALNAFNHLFPDEEQCIAYLFPRRWPSGFICPLCRRRAPHLAPTRYLVCPSCGSRSSLTTGTIMHGAKKNLRHWLLAIWWFSTSQFGSSAKDLQRLLGLSCYQTAWTWLNKLRLAMSAADATPCKGVVEIGWGTISTAREQGEQCGIFTAIEHLLLLGTTGRVRLHYVAQPERDTLEHFLTSKVEPHSSLHISSSQLTLPETLRRSVYSLTTPPNITSQTPELLQQFTTSLHTLYRGGVTNAHLQLYLDEFCFRHNAGLMPDHQAVFNSLLHGVLHPTPASPAGQGPQRTTDQQDGTL